MQTKTFQASARSSKLYAMKPTSSGNLGAAGIPGAETRGSTPPTPGMMTHNSLKKNYLLFFYFIVVSFGCHKYSYVILRPPYVLD